MEKSANLLTIQDISVVGQCSGLVASPVISTFGIETSVLPSAVLSNHTTYFDGFTYLDLTENMQTIINQFIKLNLKFDCIYIGYIGSEKQIDKIISLIDNCLNKSGIVVLDTVMADSGKYYSGFDDSYLPKMLKLSKRADVITPNITEACLLTGESYGEKTKEQTDNLLKKLHDITGAKVVLTGVNFNKGKIGVGIIDDNDISYYFNDRVDGEFCGTGDLFASVIAGGLTKGFTLNYSAQLATDFVLDSIKQTEKEHGYGVRFEKALFALANKINN